MFNCQHEEEKGGGGGGGVGKEKNATRGGGWKTLMGI